MPDSVVDTSTVAFSNGDIAGRKPGNLFDRRLTVLEQAARIATAFGIRIEHLV
jgi:hypothetical protein